MQRFVFIAVCLLLFSAAPALADFYRYVDKDGREFFVNDLKQVPQAYRTTAQQVQPDESRVSVGERPAASGKTAVLREHKDRFGRGEAYWRKRADKLRKELRVLQNKYDLVVEQEKGQEEKRRKLTGKKDTARTKLKAQLENKMLLKKRELEVGLPEEARKAEAYPGWLRE